jgi:hypothetical protein
MPDMNKIMQALGGFGAGVRGKGQEYVQNISNERKMAAVEDSLTIQSALNQGDVGLARDTLQDRIQSIGKLGGDPKQSVDLLQMMDSGNFAGALREVGTVVDYAARTGFLSQNAAPASQIVNGQLVTKDGAGGASAVPISNFTPKEPAGPLIVNQSENSEDKAMGTMRAGQYNKGVEEADKAYSMIESLDQMEAIEVETGIFEPIKGKFSAIARGFGLDSGGIDRAATSQAFNAASGRMVNEVLNAAKGPQTDSDANRAKATIAQLGDEPGAMKFKNDSLRAVSLRKIEQAEFIDRVMEGPDGTGNVRYSVARKQWNEYKRKTPNLSATVKNPTTGLPMYFYQFKDLAGSRRPGITQPEIISAWRQANGAR